MKEQKRPIVEVAVYDYKSKLLPNAKVTLEPLVQKPDKIINLKFDKQWRVYRAPDVDPGHYLLRAEAEGFESDQRDVQVDPSGLKDTFILGKEGMPFYYRGKVKVPFEPPKNLLAVSVKPDLSGKQEEELLAYASELGLQPEEVGKPIREENVRVFRFPPRTSQKNRREIQQCLSEHPRVRLVGPVVRIDEESVSFLTNELVVKFKPHITKDEIPAIAKRHKLDVSRTIPYAGNAFLLRAHTEASYDLLKTCAEIVETGMVEYAEPNLVITAVDFQVNPTDFLYSQQWRIPLINLPNAWQALQNANPLGVMPGDPGDLTFGSENITIAVMDRGIQSQTVGGVTSAAHQDFDGTITGGADKVYQFYNFTNMVPNNDAPPNDHGMGCSGVASALANNPSVVAGEEEGVVGAAPNCRILGLIRPAGGTQLQYADAYIWIAGFDPGWIADGINYPLGTVFPAVISPGADIISNSFLIPSGGVMEDCFDFLATYGRGGKGIPNFCAAGNSNINVTANNPMAAYDKAIAIAASTNNDVKSSYSSYGNDIDVCAPSSDGIGITTCDLIGDGNLVGHTGGGLDYRDNFGGTSSATPLVAGVAALMLSINPDLTWVEVRQILQDTAVQIDAGNTDPTGQWVAGFSQWYGHGRIDAEQAVIGARDYAHDRDIVARDNLADVGAVPTGSPFWNSPDIWVRNTDPVTDGAAALPAGYGDAPPHQTPISGQDNWVYVRLKNFGTADSYDFYIRIHITHFPSYEFVYPDNFIPTNRPGDPVPLPMEPGTYLIGEVHYASLAAGTDGIINVLWPQNLIPPETVMVSGSPVTWHPCLLVEVSPHDGPAPTGVHVWDNNNLAQKNTSITYPADDDTFAAAAVIGNRANRSPYLELLIDRSKVPPQVQLYVELVDPRAKERLRKFVRERKPEIVSSCCQLTFLEETRLLIDCPGVQGSGQVMLTLPAKAKLEMAGPGIRPDDARYNFTLGNFKGREVIWLAPRGQTRIPVFTDGGALIPVIFGGLVGDEVKSGNYEIRLTQLNPNGQPSGGIGVQLKIGE